MARRTWHSFAIVFVLSALFSVTIVGDVASLGAAGSTVPWYESLPAVAMDYKVHVDAGKEDCYFQYVQPGATLYISFQVSSIYSTYILHS